MHIKLDRVDFEDTDFHFAKCPYRTRTTCEMYRASCKENSCPFMRGIRAQEGALPK